MVIIDMLEQGITLQGHVRVREWSGDDYITYYDGFWEDDEPQDTGGFDTEWMRTEITFMYAISLNEYDPVLNIEVGREE